MTLLTTVPNNIARIGRAGFEYSYSALGYTLRYQGRLVTQYRTPLVKINNHQMAPAHVSQRNVELFRLIVIGIAQRMYDNLLIERNIKLGRLDDMPERKTILDWDKLLNEA